MNVKFKVGDLLAPKTKSLGMIGVKTKVFLVIEVLSSDRYKILEDSNSIQIWAQHVAEYYLKKLK